MNNKIFEKKRNRRSKNKSFSLSNTKKQNYVEIDYTMDGSVKQLFLNLTKMQIPFEYEKTLEEFFPKGMQKDEHGNYFIKVGESKTMFCGHLDTYCREYKRVWHIIDGNIIKTDGTTTLGGDDKAGITIMIKMIEAGVPGLYYFFRGEEGVTSPTGTWGSKQALRTKSDFFKNYEKCIAFDRRGNSSIISEQMYQECCSVEFVVALEDEFSKYGLNYKEDPTGMWCDSGVFMEIIPECTNISVGYKSEHTFNEEQNIDHLEKLVDVCINIDWENLPTKRDPNKLSNSIGKYRYDFQYQKYAKKVGKNYSTTTSISRDKTKRDYVTMDDMFYHIVDILEDFNYECLNGEDFNEVEEMYFSNDITGDFFGLRIIDYEIYISDDETLRTYMNIGSLEDFKIYIETTYETDELENNLNSLDKELDRILGDGNKKTFINDSYSTLQEDTFLNFVYDHYEYVDSILDYLENAAVLEISHQMWLKLDKMMVEDGYKVDYRENGNKINPDLFIDWLIDKWNGIRTYIDSLKTKRKKDAKKIKYNNRFLLSLEDSEINTDLFHYDEYQLYSKLVIDEPELVKLVLKDMEIQDTDKVRTETLKKIWEEISKIDYKRSDKKPLTAYPELFVKWLYKYKDNIKKFYNM